MYKIKSKNVDILSWCNELEESCIEQAKSVTEYTPVFKHVSLMPDAHFGYGVPIGSVVALKNAISPNMVGVDIGCGMCAVKTSLTKIDQASIKSIMKLIRAMIPLGFKKHKKENAPDKSILPEFDESMEIVYGQRKQLQLQIGTLGGGNHFIEIQKGSDGHIWFMVHSGSRNLGLQVAKHHNKIAMELNIGKMPDDIWLAYFEADSDQAKNYLKEMNYCLAFAKLNRSLMMDRIREAFAEVMACEFLEEINIHHNYAALENHFGEDVYIHRKGATSAREGELGIIPGSQGTSSYIVKGKGNLDSFQSCSHGAGRKIGRKEAIRTLNLEEEIKRLGDQGVIHSIRGKGDLDEAPSAYKDIEIVMEEQNDLVDIEIKLSPLAVIKG